MEITQTTSTGAIPPIHLPNIKPGWFIFLGILFILLGTGAIILPAVATFTAEILLGWLFICGGVFQIFRAYHSKSTGAFWIDVLGMVLYFVAGGLLLAYPIAGILTLTLFLAAFFLVEGILKIIYAFQWKPAKGWGWALFSGLIAIALAVMIYVEWPGSALWVMGLLLGIDLIFGGWALIMIAAAAKCQRS